MRNIHRTIVSAIIISKDNKILMGKKDPSKGGVEEGQSLEDALKREVQEEVGIDITPYTIESIPDIGVGVCEKVLKDTGEKVLCNMEFHRFKIAISGKTADEIKLQLSDDLVETCWFNKEELLNVKQIPGGKDFFQKLGYI